MILYHGTCLKYANNIKENGINPKYSKNTGDFGKGFYTTPYFDRAALTAKWRYAAKYHPLKAPMLLPVVMKFEVLDLDNLNSFKFSTENIEWIQFIVNNRAGVEYVNALNTNFHNLDDKYDVVYGRVADGQIQFLAEHMLALKRKVLYDEDEIENYYYSDKKAYQISFHTQEAVSKLKFIDITKIYL